MASFLQQFADMKVGERHGSVRTNVKDMIPVARAIDAQDQARRGIFRSVPAVGGARVIETDTVHVNIKDA